MDHQQITSVQSLDGNILTFISGIKMYLGFVAEGEPHHIRRLLTFKLRMFDMDQLNFRLLSVQPLTFAVKTGRVFSSRHSLIL